MKSNKIFFLALGVCLILGLLGEVKAQFMPTVYDHVFVGTSVPSESGRGLCHGGSYQ